MLRGDFGQEDSGAYAAFSAQGSSASQMTSANAVFTEQGACASQMTAAHVMDVFARLPDCHGLAADAVSASTQVKMVDVPGLLKTPKSGCPDIWIRLPRHQWPTSWSNIEDPVVTLARNLFGYPLAGLPYKQKDRAAVQNFKPLLG